VERVNTSEAVCWGSLLEGIAEIPERSFERSSLGMGQGA